MRVGIVGYGWAGQAHAGEYSGIKGVETRAVCSLRDLDSGELSERHGSRIRVFNDLQEMCKSDIDLVSICTPNALHPEQVEVAARAGKSIVIEKPVAIDLEGLRRVEQAIQSSGVRAIVCFEVKIIGHFQTMREMIRQGLLGDLHYGECDYYHGVGPWYRQYHWNLRKNCGGSSLLTAGCHSMDGLIWLMGSRPVEVFSYATQSSAREFAPYEYPTTSSTVMRFESGAVGKVASAIDVVQPYQLNVYLAGSEGAIWNDKFYTRKLGGLDKKGWSTLNTQKIDSGDVADHPYRPLFADFIESIRESREPLFSFEDAIFSHRVCLAADQSAEEGRPVRLEELN